ncbi:MAG: ribbon-helix-helix protein, CopG family [Arachnia sp.]
MQRTNIFLEERQTEALDRLAADEGVSRAEIIRRLIDRGLSGMPDDLTADLHVIDASFGAVRAIDDMERGMDDRDRHLADLWSR